MMITGFDYHAATSYERGRLGGHFLDWETRPEPFKTYPGLEPVPLTRQVDYERRDLMKLLGPAGDAIRSETVVDKEKLARYLVMTEALSKEVPSERGVFYLRSPASAGALYPTEIYAAVHGASDLEAGIYHFNPLAFSLTKLRSGDFGSLLSDAIKSEHYFIPAVTFFLTAIFFRSAWKYRDRSYRYHLLDTGHVEENLILILKALGLRFHVSYDFDDDRINRLLGIDGTGEAALSVVSLTGTGQSSRTSFEDVEELGDSIRCAGRVPEKEIHYPLIREMHESGKNQFYQNKKLKTSFFPFKDVPKRYRKLGKIPDGERLAPYPDCVLLRRSRRNFDPALMSKKHFSMFLHALCDAEEQACFKSLSTGYIAETVDGMEEGIYILDREIGRAGLVRPGGYTKKMADVCLNQGWLAPAAVHFLFMADLQSADAIYGSRGYRYLMLAAGRLGQRIYAVSAAIGLGCCGVGAFYDNEAADLLGLNERSRLVYLVAVGFIKNKL
jgi:SagB-type dehydrogenase family enzyme